MTTENETKASDCSRSIEGLVRPAFLIRKTTEGTFPDDETKTIETPVKFHGWSDTTRCAYGDGSCIYVFKIAIIEKEDGTIEYAEPHEIRFSV